GGKATRSDIFADLKRDRRKTFRVELEIYQEWPLTRCDRINRRIKVLLATYCDPVPAQSSRNRCQVRPVQQRERRIHVLASELNVLRAISVVVTDDDDQVQLFANGCSELHQPADHESTISCDEHGRASLGCNCSADRLAHAKADASRIHRMDI